jgi:hypothetical protein
VRTRPDGDGYYLTFTDRDCQLHKVLYGISTTEANPLARAAWKPDSAWHVLRLEARANRITARVDDRVLFEVKDDAALNLPSLRSGGITLAARKAPQTQGRTVIRFRELRVEMLGTPTAPCNPVGAGEAATLFAEFSKSPDPVKALALARQGPAGTLCLIRGLEAGGRAGQLCAWALWQHPQPKAAAALRTLLWQADQVAGYWAAKALGQIDRPENVQALAALLPDERLGFWELCTGGVGRITDVQGRTGRESAPAQDWMPNLRVAYAAMESLGELGGEQATQTLLRALDNDQYLIRFGAARGLGRMWQKSRPGGRGGVPSAARGREIKARLAAARDVDPILIVRLAAQQALAIMELETAAGTPSLTTVSPVWTPKSYGRATGIVSAAALPASIAFIKTANRSAANLGFRDSYYFPLTPKYHSGENLYTLTPPAPGGTLRNLTQLTHGEVQGPEVSFDGRKLLFAMRRDKEHDGFHIFEANLDGTGLRQLTAGNCNDVDPCCLPDGRVAFCSDRAGYQEYYHQERSRVICVMNGDGRGIEQITFNPNQDYEPLALRDGRLLYGSYRFYAQDGSEGPLAGEWMGLARIETVLRSANPDGSADQLFYGSMRGRFYAPLRPMPFSDQRAGWHARGYHVGVSISQPRELADGRLVCVSPAGLTLVDPARVPVDCEMPVYPEVVNLAGGERVYIHAYDDLNPVGRYTSPYPLTNDWILVSHAPWHDLRGNGYGLYLMNLATRELRLIYDDPQMSDVDPIPLQPQPEPMARESTLVRGGQTGLIYCNSVHRSDLPYDHKAAKYVRILEGVLMGQSIAANAAFRTRLLGAAPLHPDGSFYVEVPADTPVRFELLDEAGRMLVHETEFNYVRPGETKGCMGCHEPRQHASANQRPMALSHAPVSATRQSGDLIYMGKPNRPYNGIYRE